MDAIVEALDTVSVDAEVAVADSAVEYLADVDVAAVGYPADGAAVAAAADVVVVVCFALVEQVD